MIIRTIFAFLFVGLLTENTAPKACYKFFEAHPRVLPVPDVLDLGKPWLPPHTQGVVEDTFEGTFGHLDGRTTTIGGKIL